MAPGYSQDEGLETERFLAKAGARRPSSTSRHIPNRRGRRVSALTSQ